ncbi:hypothetical protein BJV82DRAFT_601409 [Fennellomyces sp. T-0311]|nr:hypothetical protein BJV82DRAFT_601409 [Fennellomyces sp. T-0311]
MADKIPSRDDRGPESDESDWEGESHVSRILREYYEKKHEPLPRWLYDERAPKPKPVRSYEQDDSMLPPLDSRPPPRPTARKQKLWEASPEPQMSQREREREELRQQRRAPVQNAYEDRTNYGNDDHDDRSSYRRPSPQRKENEGWKMSSRSNTTAARYQQQDRSPRTNYGYDDDDDYGSSRYLSERRAPPPRARSPGRYHGDDMSSSSSDYYSNRYGSPPREPRDRVRGPRDIPNQFGSRYSDRGGGYF